jgi:hypothetical protein
MPLRGAAEVFVLFFIHVSSRRVCIAGMSTRPTQAWTAERVCEALGFLAGQAGEQPILPTPRTIALDVGC